MLASTDGMAKRSKIPAREKPVGEPTVIFEGDPTLLTSTIQVVLNVGSADDPPGKAGMTSLMADMLLRGTRKKNRTAFQSAIERLGGSIHVQASHDTVVFQGKVIKENTDAFLELLGEALATPAFDKKEFAALKRETLASIAHRKNSNNRLAAMAARRELFRGTPLEYGVDGGLATVAKIELPDVVRFYNDAFNRANFVFGMAAPVTEDAAKAKFYALWSKFPDGLRRQRTTVAPRVPSKPEIVVVHKPKTSTGSIVFAQGGIVAQDPMRYALYVGNFSFGGEPLVSRLFKTIRGELGWTYAIGASYFGLGQLTFQPGIFVVSSTPSVEFTAKTILKTRAMWDAYLTKGLESSELGLAKESLVNSYPFEMESPEKRLARRLYSHTYGVPLLSPEEYGKTIGAIDNEAVLAALKARQAKQGWVIAVVADKDVVAKQLAEEQKDVPPAERLAVSRVVEPDDLVN
jgi:zinc protease